MVVSTITSLIGDPGRDGRTQGRLFKRVHGGLYLLFAAELFLLVGALVALAVFRLTYPASETPRAGIGWYVLAAASAVWGTLYYGLAGSAFRRWQRQLAHRYLAVASACGLIVTGILLVIVARQFASSPHFLDVSSYYEKRPGETAAAEPTTTGDAESGKETFQMTCASCHGPTGKGVANNAPSLRTSEFLDSADESEIASLIRNGRPANDPANTTGKVMPAKGGNPFLDEPQIRDLVAFLVNLDSMFDDEVAGGASASTNAGQPSGDAGQIDQLALQYGEEQATTVREWELGDFNQLDIQNDPQTISQGMVAFVKADCHQCHMGTADQASLGPGLGEILEKEYTTKQLLNHIINPSEKIDEKYQATSFLLMDGRTLNGVVTSRSEGQVEILPDMREPEDVVQVNEEEIDDQFQSDVSPMPTGLLNVLTEPEIKQLLAYVESGGGAGAPAATLTQWTVPDAPSAPGGIVDDVASSQGRWLDYQDQLDRKTSQRYQSALSGLAVVVSSVLVFHFVWVSALASGVVLQRELNIGFAREVRLMWQSSLFWFVGVAGLLVWFVALFAFG